MQAGLRHFTRVFGDEAVLTRMERLGRNARVFPNMVNAGFPPDQLYLASQWFAQEAVNPVERYASVRMAHGYFDDESLLDLFCRYYECTDWKLQLSPWFLSRDDYQRFIAAMTNPVEFHIAQLEEGYGEERWGGFFLKLPFDLGMDRAKQSLWEEICRKEYFWKPLETYAHLRSEAMFRYLRRTVDILNFSPHRFNYYWERSFRDQFAHVLHRFEEKLEQSVRFWQEQRKEREHRFHYRSYRHSYGQPGIVTHLDLREAFSVLGLDPQQATLPKVRKAFRRLSKKAHPDHGGDPEAFRRLSESKELAETWLKRHAMARA